MRPAVRFLEDSLLQKIIEEARHLLCQVGVEIHNASLLDLLAAHGARLDRGQSRAYLTQEIIDKALKSSPSTFSLYDVHGAKTHQLGGGRTEFTPGSAAIHIVDDETGAIRRPVTADCVRYAKLVQGLPSIASQSTALVPADVPERISDSYRLFLALTLGRKPVVTGAFTIDAFEIMRDLQLAVRGSAEALREKPLCIFSCCPTSPLKWSDVTSQNVVDCGRAGIPIEFISMPLSGFMAPVTLVGTLIAHTAETLSGVVISQLSTPGAPMLYGGSPAIFDIRYETTPMGAIETQMIDCAYAEIGRSLHLPTQAYIGLSDAKALDAQAGLETASGLLLAVLSSIDHVSGPGMLDFESCFSLEKLVVDHEICRSTHRLLEGIVPREDFPSQPLFEELLREKHLLIARHTRKHLKSEITFPGKVIERANLSRWHEEGATTLSERAKREVARVVGKWEPNGLSLEVLTDLYGRMSAEAKRWGLDALPYQAS